ncbi:hypothetical protein AGR7A_pAt20332 [Agrobacterium deltaense NCPPB 1641]|uniref:Uncharacterized protein n=1 Tax=Agrobacterium deltaense NCPPB 1641 TaxID=1183425 RepID=A0A1S7UAU5_9HYPH|nr:hypothetical protein AGR7A_pAt20332 [Agrobacterium deltaense NCPPB 1641]
MLLPTKILRIPFRIQEGASHEKKGAGLYVYLFRRSWRQVGGHANGGEVRSAYAQLGLQS